MITTYLVEGITTVIIGSIPQEFQEEIWPQDIVEHKNRPGNQGPTPELVKIRFGTFCSNNGGHVRQLSERGDATTGNKFERGG